MTHTTGAGLDLDYLQMLYRVRPDGVRFQSRRARTALAEAVPELIAEIDWRVSAAKRFSARISELEMKLQRSGQLGEAWQERTGVAEAEVKRLRQHILDIEAHATPYGDIPEEPGYVGTYLVTAGALHRALGTIGHTAPNCEAEAEVARLRAELAARDDRTAIYDGMRRVAMSMHHELNTIAEQIDAAAFDEHAEQAIAGVTDVQLTDEQTDRLVRDIKDGGH